MKIRAISTCSSLWTDASKAPTAQQKLTSKLSFYKTYQQVTESSDVQTVSTKVSRHCRGGHTHGLPTAAPKSQGSSLRPTLNSAEQRAALNHNRRHICGIQPDKATESHKPDSQEMTRIAKGNANRALNQCFCQLLLLIPTHRAGRNTIGSLNFTTPQHALDRPQTPCTQTRRDTWKWRRHFRFNVILVWPSLKQGFNCYPWSSGTGISEPPELQEYLWCHLDASSEEKL